MYKIKKGGKLGTTTIVLRKDKINSKDEAPIHFRIVRNRRSSYISSGIKIPVKYWDEKNRRIKPGFQNSTRFNNQLANKFKEVQGAMLTQETENKYISVKGIVKSINGTNCPSFFELGDMILNRSKADGKIATYDLRHSILVKFKKFLKGNDIQITDISAHMLQQYEKYLQTEFKNAPNTRHRDFKFLKMVYKEAYRLGFIIGQTNPFDQYKLKLVTTTKEFLSENEIDAIENKDLSATPDLIPYRNIFIFACYAYGIRVSDLILLNENQLSEDRIKLKTKKTSNQLDVRLPKKALEILEWFRSINNGNPFIFNLCPPDINLKDPVIVDDLISQETAKYNKALKCIGELVEIDKNFNSHLARHSWATRALRKGVDLYQVSALLTHASVKQTQVYAKIVSEELDKVSNLF